MNSFLRMQTAKARISETGRRGFTLVEMLLALGIFTVIAVSLYMTYANGIKINRKAQSLENFYRGVRAVFDTLTMDLENMVPYTTTEDGKDKGIFKGDERSLTLLLPSDECLQEVTYELQDPKEGKVHQVIINPATQKNVPITIWTKSSDQVMFLIRRVRPWVSVAEPSARVDRVEVRKSTQKNVAVKVGEVGGSGILPEGEGEILSLHVLKDSLKLWYAEKPQNTDSSEYLWKEGWDLPINPVAVRVEISFLNPDEPQYPLRLQKDILIPLSQWGDGQ